MAREKKNEHQTRAVCIPVVNVNNLGTLILWFTIISLRNKVF